MITIPVRQCFFDSFFLSIQQSPDTFYRIRAAYGGIEVALFVEFQLAAYSARIVSASF